MSGGMGYWGAPSATVDWCEENYTRTPFVAEFWNTLSSVPIAAAGLLGAVYAFRAGLETRVVASFSGMFVIGLGSIAFHGTLLHLAQALDELPMLYASLVLLFTVLRLEGDGGQGVGGRKKGLSSGSGAHDGSERLLAAFLLAIGVADTAAYYLLEEERKFVFFFASYVGVIALLCVLAFRLYRRSTDTTARRFFLAGCVTYVAGFLLLWIPEQLYCGWYQTENGWHLQLHAWFHLTSTVGPYAFITFITLERYRRLGARPTIRTGPDGLLPVVWVGQQKEKQQQRPRARSGTRQSPRRSPGAAVLVALEDSTARGRMVGRWNH